MISKYKEKIKFDKIGGVPKWGITQNGAAKVQTFSLHMLDNEIFRIDKCKLKIIFEKI